jgi:hypothetical protein
MHHPVSPETLKALHTAAEAANKNGDPVIALILAGVRLYAELGREYDLLEGMRHFVEEMDEAVRNTPTAEQLRSLYSREDSGH